MQTPSSQSPGTPTNTPKPHKRRALDATAFILAIVCCFIWGLQQVAIKGTGGDISPLLQVSIRTVFALILTILAQVFYFKEKWNPDVRWFHGLLIGFLYAGEFYFVAEGLRLGPSSHISVLLYTAPLFAAVGLSLAIPEERLKAIQWVGIFAAFGGVAFSILYPALTAHESALSSTWLLGDIFGVLGGLSWAFTTLAIRTTPMSNAAPTQMLFWQLLGGLIFLVLGTVVSGQTHFEWTFWSGINLIFQSAIVSFASYLAWCWMLRHYLANHLGVLSFMTPIFGMLLSVLVLGETLQGAFLFGAFLVFVGLILVQLDIFRRFLRQLFNARGSR